jgi:hypothetical protein
MNPPAEMHDPRERETLVRCIDCDGAGWVREASDDEDVHSGVTCETCDGRGWLTIAELAARARAARG